MAGLAFGFTQFFFVGFLRRINGVFGLLNGLIARFQNLLGRFLLAAGGKQQGGGGSGQQDFFHGGLL